MLRFALARRSVSRLRNHVLRSKRVGQMQLTQHGALLFLMGLHASQNVIEDSHCGHDVRAFVQHDALPAKSDRGRANQAAATNLRGSCSSERSTRCNVITTPQPS